MLPPPVLDLLESLDADADVVCVTGVHISACARLLTNFGQQAGGVRVLPTMGVAAA